MRCIFKRICCSRKLSDDVQSVRSQKRRDLGQSYVEHRLSIEELCEIYTDSFIDANQPDQSDGLSCVEAQKRLQDGGLNVVQKPHQPSRIRLLINQHFYQFWLLLIGASVLSIVAYLIRFYTHNDDTAINLTTAYILLPVVFIMSMLSLWQEKRTMHTVNTHETALSKNSTVLRDCRTMVVPTDHLVIGDLVYIFSGQRIPADIRILQSSSLKIDTSAIIGKSDSVDYTHELAFDKNVSVFEARNVVFQGTYCVEGDALGLVIRTGRFTFLGNMADVKFLVETKSLLRKDIKQTVDIISKVAIGMALLFFFVGIVVAHFENVLYYFVVGFLIIIVANVPQGLAPAIMSYLAIIAKRLRRKDILIKNLDTIDELGASTVLATSKAGILTQNCLTITDVWYNQKNCKVGKDLIKQHKRIQQHIDESKSREALHQIMGICSRVWRHSAGFGNYSVRRARAASLAAARRESAFQALPLRKKMFTVVHESGYESIRRPDDYEKRPSILSESSISKNSSVNELNLLELGEDFKPKQQTTNTLLTTTSSVPECQYRNSTDTAMQNYLFSIGYPMEHLKRYYKPVYEVPYNSNRRYQFVVCRCLSKINNPLFPQDELSDDQTVYVSMIKGAPEVVLRQSTSFFTDKNGVQEINDAFKEECFLTWEKYSLNGKRTIAFGLKFFVGAKNEKFNAGAQNFPKTELIFIGFGAFLDPPKPDSVQAIQMCKDAGMKIYMTSGDHPATLLAIACQIGLVEEKIENIPKIHSQLDFVMQKGKNWAVVIGKLLPTMTQHEWDELLSKPYIIFARTTPEETLYIVEACQSRNEIIALVAGSVSDAPNLAKANIGIASNQTSTDIAIKAADIVLNEDSLSTVIHGIEAGRVLFENLQLSIAYTLAHLWPEVCPIILNFAFGLPLGLDPMQILTIDLACELPPAIALAYERPESDLMKCPPRQKQKRLVTIPLLIYSYIFVGSLISIGCLAAYFSVYYYNDVELHQLFFNANDFWHGNAENLTVSAGTKVLDSMEQMRIRGEASAAYQICLVISQVFHLFACTTRRVSLFKRSTNLPVFLAVALEISLLLLFMYVPFFQFLLGIQTPPTFVWIFGLVSGTIILIFTEIRKLLLRHSTENKCIELIEW